MSTDRPLARPDPAINRTRKQLTTMHHARALFSFMILLMTLLLVSCFSTLEQRWERFDEQMRLDIGVKTKDYYIREWGNPTKRTTLVDGGSTLTWQFRGYGGNQGWNKTLIFTPDGVLKEFHREYWPKEN